MISVSAILPQPVSNSQLDLLCPQPDRLLIWYLNAFVTAATLETRALVLRHATGDGYDGRAFLDACETMRRERRAAA